MLSSLSNIDHSLFWLINAHHNVVFDYFFGIITNLGNGWYVTPILLFFVLKKIPRHRLTAFIIFSVLAMTTCGLINSQIKKHVSSSRPLAYFSAHPIITQTPQGSDTAVVHVVGEKLMRQSFPSGHTHTAFSAAALLALSFGGWYWISLIPAFLVGYSRIYVGAHFPVDVVCGALLGFVIMWIGYIIYCRLFFSGANRDKQ
jgi:membrane-associated phospholipid phosphatase